MYNKSITVLNLFHILHTNQCFLATAGCEQLSIEQLSYKAILWQVDSFFLSVRNKNLLF